MNCPNCLTPIPEDNRFCYECGNFLGVHPGYALGGRFIVDRLLGTGGFARAYLGFDQQRMDAPVVIKELAPSESQSQLQEIFASEARTLVGLKHSAIPTCFAYFEELGHHYLVLEYMQGPTLLEAITRHGKLATDIVRALMVALLDALDYLHGQSPPLIHGDLSPENIVMMASGRVGLIDFGAIRTYDPELAAQGPLVGKELYAAPEQRRGEIHPASDLYALGVTALYLLEGQHPRNFYDEREGGFRWHEQALSPLLNTVLRRLLAPELRDRFASASEALDVLKYGRSRVGDGSPSTAGPSFPDLPPFSQVRAPYHVGGGAPPEGKLCWRYKVGPVLSSPAVKNGILYIGSLDHLLTALDAFTGRFMWKFAAKGPIACSPAVDDQGVVIGDESGSVYALDALSGVRKWTFRTGSPVGSSPVVSGGVVYFGANDGYFYAIAPGGAERWRCISNLNDRIRSSPAISGPLVFIGTHGGSLFAFDRESGNPQWEFKAKGAVTISPVVDAGRVYVGCREGGFYGIDAYTGQLVWEFKAQSAIDASPAIAGGRVFFGSRDGSLFCLEASDGQLLWKFAVSPDGTPSPLSAIALVDDRLYVGTRSGRFYALDARDGSTLWWYQTSAPIRSSAVVAGGLAFVACEDGYVHALQ